jgi:hypothetical protein
MKKCGVTVRIVLLFGWIFGILLPLASFRRFSSSYRAAFDWVFNTEASHVLMHTFLYAVLAFLVACVLPRTARTRGRVAVLALASVGIVALSQETIQIACEQSHLEFHEVFDWLVDANAGLLGAMIFVRLACQGRKQETDEDPYRKPIRCS